MRAWPRDLSGLKLQLAPGWYPLASYMPATELRRLLDLLAVGLDGVDHTVELDWDALEAAAGRLQLSKSVVVLRLPAELSLSDDELRRARAKLGSVRLGLLRYEASETWGDVAWQERHVKVPLLAWLKRQLRDPAHPFAKLGVEALPIDELAKLTAEPIELLEMVEAALDHRLRYVSRGMAPEDWLRSVTRVAADRLADRLLAIPDQMRAGALDLAMSGDERALMGSLDDSEAARALARVGLAWQEGNDVLMGPLAQLASDHAVVRRLVERLPEDAWLARGKLVLRHAMPAYLPLPRTVLVAPEPPYWRWPAVIPEPRRVLSGLRATAADEQLLLAFEDLLDALVRGEVGRQMSLWERTASDAQQRWLVAMDAVAAAFAELQDTRLVELDFQRGGLHRFEAVDRALLDWPGGAELCAFIRWLGINSLLDRTHSRARLMLLASEVERAIRLADPEGDVSAALRVLRGDLFALAHDYRAAVACWTDVDHPKFDAITRSRLAQRRQLAYLRLDDWAAVEADVEASEDIEDEADAERSEFADADDVAFDLLNEFETLTERLISLQEGNEEEPFESEADWLEDNQTIRVTRVAAALELGDWPHAIRLANSLDLSGDGAVPARARLLCAWIKASLGDVDHADAVFVELCELGERDGDSLLEALALRGRAMIALIRDDIERVLELLERAYVLEQGLELRDVQLLELELTGWKVLMGRATTADYVAKIVPLTESSSPSLMIEAFTSQFRLVAISLHLARANKILLTSAALREMIEGLQQVAPLAATSTWFARLCERLVEYVSSLAASGVTEHIDELFAAARLLAGDDEKQLAWIDSQAALHDAPDTQDAPS